MNRRDYILLYLAALTLYALAAIPLRTPGYMDADYYTAVAARLASGAGFTEPFLWNYLNAPPAIPAPAHAYWMPLNSFLAALGMLLAGADGFRAAQWFFVALSALVPPLTAALAYRLTARRPDALLSAVFALLPGFYLPFLLTVDAFGVYMLLGALFLLTFGDVARPAWQRAALLGGIAALMHLTLADGLLWLPLVLLATAFLPSTPSSPNPLTPSPPHPLTSSSPHPLTSSSPHPPTPSSLIPNHLSLTPIPLLTYLLLTLPWFVRNLSVFGTPLAPGGSRALWQITYNDLYAYPAEQLTLARWLALGWVEILQARLWALGQNLQTFLAVQGLIFALPLMLWGAWRLRTRPEVRLAALSWLLTLLAMTLAFPFAGARGGFFHSGAALQPLMWALVPVGLRAFIEWGAARRGWRFQSAWRVFAGGLLALALGLTALLYMPRLIASPEMPQGAWNHSALHYRALESALQTLGAQPSDRVLVNNPPGFYLASERESFAIPDGKVDTLLAVAQRYNVRYVLLEPNYRGGPLEALYTSPNSSPNLRYLQTVEETLIFEILSE